MINTTGRAGFLDANFAELGQGRFEVLPDPLGENFGGGVFQAFDVVQVVVIETVVKGLESVFDIGEVGHPAGM